MTLSGPQLVEMAEYFAEIIEDGDRLIVREQGLSGEVAAHMAYEDGTIGQTRVFGRSGGSYRA